MKKSYLIFILLLNISVTGCAAQSWHDAIKRNDIKTVHTLLDKGMNVNEHFESDFTALHYAAGWVNCNIEIVRLLVKSGADIDSVNIHGLTPLHKAAARGCAKIVRFLIEKGANINKRTNDDWAPLHFAARYGKHEVVRLLLDLGSDINVHAKPRIYRGEALVHGGTPLKIAQKNGHIIIARMIKEAEEKRNLTVKKSDSSISQISTDPLKPTMTTVVKKESSQLSIGDPPMQKYSIMQHWAVIIGISKYQYSGQNGLTNLIFADDDAKAFARVLKNLGWNESHIKLLINEDATQRSILIALESWLTKAGPNDQIILFWAGHGFPDPEDPEKVYFACYDTDILIPATGFRMDRVRSSLEERKAQNVVIFADTCHAGKLITRGGRGLSIVPNIDKMRRERKIPKGWIFMVGAETDRQAIEHTSWSNGAFTHCLLKALRGSADGYESVGAKDGIVTMGELRAYLNSAMPDETQRVLGVAKRPVITTSTGDPDIWNLTLQAK